MAEPADTPRWTQRPPGSNWGDFGADDQCGRMNLLTPERGEAGQSPRSSEGLTFCLSLPLDFPAATCSIRAATRRCCGRRCATASRT